MSIQTDYAYKENGQFVWPVAMRSRFNNIGGWHTFTDERRVLEEWYPIEYTNKVYNPATQVQTLVSSKLEDNVFKVEYSVRDLTADEHARIKKDEIRAELVNSFNDPVEALNLLWSAGFNSSLSIDGAARIAQATGLTEVTLYSDDNKPHILSISDATQVAAAIGVDYQQKFAAKQSQMVALDEIDLSSANAIADIAAV